MIDREAVLQKTDLLALIERDVGPAVRQSGRWWFWRCPFHAQGQEQQPSLGVTPDNGKWKCFGQCGTSGNAIDWVMRREDVSFVEACRRLGAMDLPEPSFVVKPDDLAIRSEPPPDPWQWKALDLVDACQETLWGPQGARALGYLRERGFVDETIEEWRLGFSPTVEYEPLEAWGFETPDDGKRHGMWIPRGITIPCFGEGGDELHYVKIRRSPTEYQRDGMGKYIKLKGSVAGLYGADHIRQRDVLVLEEGELNGLTIWQEAGNLVDVASTGTSSVRPESLRPWWGVLMMAHYVLVRFDLNAAEKGERLKALSRRVRMVQVPQGSDPNAYLAQHGGNVRAWIAFELARLEAQLAL